MSDTLNGLNALNANTYTNSLNSTGNSIQNTINNSDLSNASDDELKSVCKDFEEYFVEQMVKSMMKMADVSGKDDPNDFTSIFGMSDSSSSGMSTMSSYYGGQLVTMLSKSICNSDNGKGIGLANNLYEQMKRNYGIKDASDASDSSDTKKDGAVGVNGTTESAGSADQKGSAGSSVVVA